MEREEEREKKTKAEKINYRVGNWGEPGVVKSGQGNVGKVSLLW